MKLAIEANKVYRPLWKTRKRYVVVMGGRGVGRSYEASQKIIACLTQTARFFRAAIMRAVHADIRHSIWQELVDRVNAWEIETAVHIVDTTMEMDYGKNSVHAHGLRDLAVPGDFDLFLGLVHLSDSAEGGNRRMRSASKARESFGIATECGFGRRPPETVPDLFRLHLDMADG